MMLSLARTDVASSKEEERELAMRMLDDGFFWLDGRLCEAVAMRKRGRRYEVEYADRIGAAVETKRAAVAGLRPTGKAKARRAKRKRYYVIYETRSECAPPSPAYIADTLEEAEGRVSEYADWYCPRGTCRIKEVDGGLNAYETRYYESGELTEVDKGPR